MKRDTGSDFTTRSRVYVDSFTSPFHSLDLMTCYVTRAAPVPEIRYPTLLPRQNPHPDALRVAILALVVELTRFVRPHFDVIVQALILFTPL